MAEMVPHMRSFSSSGPQGIGRIGMPMIKRLVWIVRIKGIVYAVRTDSRRQRHKSAGYALGQANDIRRDSRFLTGENSPGRAESAHHPAKNGKKIEGAKRSPKLGKKCRPAHPHAAGSLDKR